MTRRALGWRENAMNTLHRAVNARIIRLNHPKGAIAYALLIKEEPYLAFEA